MLSRAAPRPISNLAVVVLLGLGGCGDFPESMSDADCQRPADPLPGPVVDLSELGDPDEPIDFEATCMIIQNALLDVNGALHLDLDCGSPIIRLELDASGPAAAGGEVGLRVHRDEDGLDLRIHDGLGAVLVLVEGLVEPASEQPLSWQLETSCRQTSGEVGADLVVRDSQLEEVRVKVGTPRTASVESRTYELSAFAASIERETGVARGTLTLLRRAN